jgi:hypothetical protein
MEPMELATEESDEIDQLPPQHSPSINVINQRNRGI